MLLYISERRKLRVLLHTMTRVTLGPRLMPSPTHTHTTNPTPPPPSSPRRYACPSLAPLLLLHPPVRKHEQRVRERTHLLPSYESHFAAAHSRTQYAFFPLLFFYLLTRLAAVRMIILSAWCLPFESLVGK